MSNVTGAAGARERTRSWRFTVGIVLLLSSALLAAVTTLAPSAPSATAQTGDTTCYSINDDGGVLVSFTDGVETIVGTSGLVDAESLAAHDDLDELWTYDHATQALYSFAAGSATPVFEASFTGGDLDSLTWVNHANNFAADDQLWGTIRNGANNAPNVPDQLVRINPTTGAIITGPLTIQDPGGGSDELDDNDGLAWDPRTDRLYGVIGGDTSPNRLIVINRTNGTLTSQLTLSLAGGPIFDIESLGVSLDGQIYAATGEDPTTPQNFYSIDKVSGVVTPVSAITGGVDFEGTACLSTAPPPVLIPQTCYTINEGGNAEHLVRLDIAADASLTATDLGIIPVGNGNIENLGYRNGFDPQALYAQDPLSDDLLRIDRNDGTVVSVVPNFDNVNLGDIDGLTWRYDNDTDPNNDELWVIIRRGGLPLDQIAQVDLNYAGVGSPFLSGPTDVLTPGTTGSAGLNDVDGLAWDPLTDQFFSVIGGGGENNPIITIDETSGVINSLGFSGVQDIEGLGFDDAGVFYGTTGNGGASPDRLVLINKTTGLSRVIGDLSSTGFDDFESFDCAGVAPVVQPDLDIRLTVVPAADACPVDFASAVEGLGTPLVIASGDNAKYCVNVINNGAGDAQNVTVEDPFNPGTFLTLSATSLSSGQEATASVTVTAGPATTNPASATVNGEDTLGNPVPPAEDPAVIDLVEQPDVQIRLTVVPAGNPCPADFASATEGLGAAVPIDSGSDATYCVNVINNGPDTAQNVTVSDPFGGPDIVLDATTLTPGQQATGSVTVTVDTTTTNPVSSTVTAEDRLGNPTAPDTDPAQIQVIETPVLDIRLTVIPAADTCPATYAAGVEGLGTPLSIASGDDAKYCVNVINTGNAVAQNVTVEDPFSPGTFLTLSATTLAPDEEATASVTITVGPATTNPATATVNGEDSGGTPLAPADDPALIDVVEMPSLDIRLTVVPAADPCPVDYASAVEGLGAALLIADGADAKYCVNVINNGPGTAQNVTVEDPFSPGTFLTLSATTLAPDEEATGSVIVTVSPTTLNPASATVNGEDTLGNPLTPADDPAQIDVVETSTVNIRLTVVPAADPCPVDYASAVEGLGAALLIADGADAKYCVNVINNGPGTAQNVTVEDPFSPGTFLTLSATTLAPDEEATGSVIVTVSPTTLNPASATVNADDRLGNPLAPDEDPAQIDVVETPAIDIRLTVVPVGDPCPATYAAAIEGVGPLLPVANGGDVTYCVNVINNGPDTAQNVTVEDPFSPGTFLTLSATTLAPDEEATGLVTITASPTNPNPNPSTAIVNGEDRLANALPPASDPAGIDVVETPVIDIRLTVVPPADACPATYAAAIEGVGPLLQIASGDDAKYCVNVINNGPDTAQNVTVEDPFNPGTFLTLSATTLAPDEEATGAVTITVSPTNPNPNPSTAIVNGEDRLANALAPASDPAGIDVVETPVIDIRLTVVPASNPCPSDYASAIEGVGPLLQIASGDDATYCVNVINNGPDTAQNVTVEDPFSPGTFLTLSATTLAPGEEATGAVTITVSPTNPNPNPSTAIVNGEDRLANALAPASDPAGIEVIEPPSLDVRLTVVNEADPCPATYAAAIEGLGSPLLIASGANAKYCVNVINNGPGDAQNITVEDPFNPGTFLTLSATALAPAEEATASVTIPVDNTTTNPASAVVNGDDALGNPLPSANDPAVIDLVETPVIDIRLTVVNAADPCPPDYAAGIEDVGPLLPIADGDNATYCVNVINNGPDTAQNVTVEDPFNPGTFLTLSATTLAPGEEATGAVTITVSPTNPVPNPSTAIVNGQDRLANALAPASDPAGIDVVETPVIDIRLTVVPPADPCPASYAAAIEGVGPLLLVADGADAKYCVNVFNTGPDAAENVTVEDPFNPGSFLTLSSTSLAAGEQATSSVTIAVSPTNPNPNPSTAIVNGEDRLGNALVPANDPAGIDVVQTPVIDIRLTVVPPADPCPATYAAAIEDVGPLLPVANGDNAKYCVNVINNGPDTAQNVTVEDPFSPGTFLTLSATTLAPDEEATGAVTITVSPTNPNPNPSTAIVNGEDRLANALPPASDPAGIDVVETPVIDIRLTVVNAADPCPADYAAGIEDVGPLLSIADGDNATYCVNVINNGPDTAQNVTVEDPFNPGTFLTLSATTLAPGEEATGAVTITVSPTNPNPNPSTAIVNGEDRLANALAPASDPAGIDVVETPVIDIRLTVVNAADPCPANYASGVEDVGPLLQIASGDDATYCVNVINNGPDTAQNVTVEDPFSPGTFLTLSATTLAPGEEATGAVTITVSPTNPNPNPSTAIVNGEDRLANALAPASDPAGIEVIEPSALDVRLTVVNEADPCPATYAAAIEGLGSPLLIASGANAKYCVNVINNGPGDAQNITVEDPFNPGTFLTLSATALAPAEEATASVTIPVDNTTTNPASAVVNGDDALGNPLPSANDPAVIDLVETPVIDIRLTVVPVADPCPTNYAGGVEGIGTPLTVTLGDDVTYCVNVINNGPDTAQNVTVEDPFNPGTFLTLSATSLTPAQEATASFTVTVDAATPLQVTGVVNGEDRLANALAPANDPAAIDPQQGFATIGNYVWDDENGNGAQDTEPGIANVQITVYTVDAGGNLGSVFASPVTDTNGQWQIQVPPGRYRVAVTLPPNGSFTTQDAAGVPDDQDSDVATSGPDFGFTGIYDVADGETNLTIDAGVTFPPLPATLGDFVWLDENGNGVQDPLEPGIAGIRVDVLDGSQNVVDFDTTDTNGAWSVSVPPGTYTVRVINTTAGAFTTPLAGGDTTADSNVDATGVTAPITLAEGENNPTIDAGILPVENPVIGLAKDLTAGPTLLGNGNWSLTYTFLIENMGDVALSDIVLVDDFAATFAPDGTVVSGPTPNGGTCSAAVATGTGALAVGASCVAVWDVEVSGLVAGTTYNNTATVTGTSPLGEDVSDISDDGTDVDTDNDGNPNEPGENDPTPALVPENPVIGLAKELVGTPTLNGAGNHDITYSFVITNLGDVALSDIALADDFAATFAPDGTVVSGPTPNGGTCSAAVATGTGALAVGASCVAVWDVEVSGLVAGTTYNNTATVTGTSPLGEDVSDISDDGTDVDTDNDGNPNELGENDPTPTLIPAPGLAILGDRVWSDLNANGIQDPTEPGIPGVTVQIYTAGGTLLEQTVTGANGIYTSSPLAAGSFVVAFVVPANYFLSPQGAGSDPTVDSNAGPDGLTAAVAVGAGETNLTIDAGLMPAAQLGNVIFNDTNANGLQDPGEGPVAGVTVTLFKANPDGTKGAQVGTQVTGADGVYLFDGLEPGDYIVVIRPPAGFGLTIQNAGGDDETDSDFSPTTGESGVISLLPGANNQSVDAGLVPLTGCNLPTRFNPTFNAFIDPCLPGVVIEYPGPFDNVPVTQTTMFTAPDAQVATADGDTSADGDTPLALTGGNANLLTTLSIAMMGFGGLLLIGARRERDEEFDV